MKPEFVEVDNERYKINTDYRVALKCQEVSLDEKIGEYEKMLAIIFLLFGEKGLNAFDKHASLLELGQKYLLCGRDIVDDSIEPDMDYNQDMSLIEASFMSDYSIDLEGKEMHWWKFNDLTNGLTEDSALNRVRYLRTYDLSEIKDPKLKSQISKQKESVSLKKKIKINNKQKESVDRFYKLTGYKRKDVN